MKDREIDEILKRAGQVPHPVDPALLGRVVDSSESSMAPVRPLAPAGMLAGGLVTIAVAIAMAGAVDLHRAGGLDLDGGMGPGESSDPRQPVTAGLVAGTLGGWQG